MSTISNDYTFSIQTCQNCILIKDVHHINHCTWLPKMRPPNTTLHFCYTNKCPPIQHNTFLVWISQNCAPCTIVHYINHYTLLHKHQNCEQTQMSTNSMLHFPCPDKPKLRPSHNTLHFPYKHTSTTSITTHFLCKQAKIASTKWTTTLLLYKKCHSAGLEPAPTDFNSVVVARIETDFKSVVTTHQISTLLR